MENLRFSHGGNIYEFEKKYGEGIIDFSANINPLGLPVSLKNKFIQNYKYILCYPDPKGKALVDQIANYWEINEENILLGNGSCELIYLIIHTFMPKKVLIPVPTFTEYERATNSIKAKVQFLQLKEQDAFRLNISNSQTSDIIFICNPNNPTGNLLLKDKDLDNSLSKLIVVDEAFMDFLPDEKRYAFIKKATEDKRIIVLRSFTKFFALAGLRLGYIVAHKQIIQDLKSHQPPWSINSLAQILGKIILEDKEYIRASRQFIERERNFLFNAITKIKGLMPYPTVTNFLLVKIKDKDITSSGLAKRLIQRGILIRDCSNFRGLNYKFIRVAVRSHQENLKLIKALNESI